MRGGDKIDVMAAAILQSQHHLGQVPRRDLPPGLLLADVIVLTEEAGEIAAGEEYGARAGTANKAVLLPEVGGVAGDACKPAGAAEAPLI